MMYPYAITGCYETLCAGKVCTGKAVLFSVTIALVL